MKTTNWAGSLSVAWSLSNINSNPAFKSGKVAILHTSYIILDVGEGSKLKVQTFNYSILQQTFKKVRFWRLETFKSFKKVRFWRLETFKSFKNNRPEGLNYLSWRFLKVFKIFFKNSKNMKIVIPALLKMVILKLYVLECTFHPNILSL